MTQRPRLTCALLIAAIPAAFLAMNGCAGSPHEPSEKYILVATSVKVPYWQSALAGLNHAATEMKVKAEMDGPDTYDPKAEVDEFRRAEQEKPSGILVSAADANLMGPAIDEALGKGIPVITVDSDAPNSKRLFFVGTDNYNAGTLGGNLAAKLMNGKGNVVVFTMPGQANLKDRLHGYQDAFTEHPGIKIAQVVDIKGDPTVAFDTTKQLIGTKADISAFVCLVSIACPEVGEIINREKMVGKMTVISMDTDPRTLDWIQKGVISATIAQKPFTMAYYGAKVLDDLHHHPPNPLTANWAENSLSPIPTFIDTGTFVIDKTNIGAFKQQQSGSSTAQ